MIRQLFFLVLVGALAVADSRSADVSGTSSSSVGGGGVYSQPAPDTTVAEKDIQYSQPLIENPAYDPSLYTSFVPQDAVQQYVSHYGGPYGGPPSYFGGDPSFAVQSGYEGYLVPTIPGPYGAVAPPAGDPFSFAKIAPFGYGYVKSLFPVIGKVLLGAIGKLAVVAVSTLGLVVAGGFVTSLLCAFTPICKLSFAGIPFLKLKDTAKQLTSTLESEVTQDRVRRAAEFVRMALAKYNELQSEFSSSETPQAAVVAEPEEKKDN